MPFLLLLSGRRSSPIYPLFCFIRKAYTSDGGRVWGYLMESRTSKGTNECILIKNEVKNIMSGEHLFFV